MMVIWYSIYIHNYTNTDYPNLSVSVGAEPPMAYKVILRQLCGCPLVFLHDVVPGSIREWNQAGAGHGHGHTSFAVKEFIDPEQILTLCRRRDLMSTLWVSYSVFPFSKDNYFVRFDRNVPWIRLSAWKNLLLKQSSKNVPSGVLGCYVYSFVGVL
jgi:hypothetical protein